jgi:hypothetical protein
VCTADSYFCQSGDIYYCDYNGVPYLSTSCQDDMTCELVGNGGAVCAPLDCSPTQRACLNNQIGTCAADGKTITSVTDDCAASTTVCTADFKCAASVVDTLGSAESAEVVYSGYLIANAIDVTSSRELTQIQAQLVLASARELRWVIYELTGSTYVAKLDKLVASVTGTGFLSSPTFSFPLVAGKRYLLGVVVGGGDGVTYYDTAPVSPAISFGNFVGRTYGSYSPSLDIGSVYGGYAMQMKFATEAP